MYKKNQQKIQKEEWKAQRGKAFLHIKKTTLQLQKFQAGGCHKPQKKQAATADAGLPATYFPF